MAVFKKIIKIFDYLFTFVIICLCVVVGVYTINKTVFKNQHATMLSFSYFYIETGSMEDTISIGDIIITRKCSEYNVDEVITFIFEGEEIPTTHRIKGIDFYGNYITKGDANSGVDSESVSIDNVIGKVVYVIEDGDVFFNWLLHENGYIYFVSGLVVILVGVHLIKKK